MNGGKQAACDHRARVVLREADGAVAKLHQTRDDQQGRQTPF
jgi:hypothetical protein